MTLDPNNSRLLCTMFNGHIDSCYMVFSLHIMVIHHLNKTSWVEEYLMTRITRIWLIPLSLILVVGFQLILVHRKCDIILPSRFKGFTGYFGSAHDQIIVRLVFKVPIFYQVGWWWHRFEVLFPLRFEFLSFMAFSLHFPFFRSFQFSLLAAW